MRRNTKKINVEIDQEIVMIVGMRNERNAVVHVTNVKLKKTEIEIGNVKDPDQKRSDEIQGLEIMKKINVQKFQIVMKKDETETVTEIEKEKRNVNVNVKEKKKKKKKKRENYVKKNVKRSVAVHQTNGKIMV